MMRVLILATVGLVASVMTVQAAVIYSEDFETGVDGWGSTSGSISPTVTNNYPRPADNSVWCMGTASNSGVQFYHTLADPYLKNWYVSWKFFDGNSGMSYLQMASPSLVAPGIIEYLALGAYNGTGGSSDYYSWGFGSAAGQGWTATSIARTYNQWHNMGIGVNSSGLASFYIDGQLAGTRSTSGLHPFDGIYVGSQYASTGGYACFDNINFAVPEPASLLAMASGLIGLMGWRRKRSS